LAVVTVSPAVKFVGVNEGKSPDRFGRWSERFFVRGKGKTQSKTGGRYICRVGRARGNGKRGKHDSVRRERWVEI